MRIIRHLSHIDRIGSADQVVHLINLSPTHDFDACVALQGAAFEAPRNLALVDLGRATSGHLLPEKITGTDRRRSPLSQSSSSSTCAIEVPRS